MAAEDPEVLAQRWTRHHRRRRRIALAAAVALITAIAAGQWLTPAAGRLDSPRFNHQRFAAAATISGNEIQLNDPARTVVRLIGIAGSAAHDPIAIQFLRDQLLNRTVVLLLEPPQSRDARGDLLAHVYLDNQNVAVLMAQAGAARIDRQYTGIMHGILAPAEQSARRKKRGLWAALT